jgi:hypothetical protein
LIKKKLLKKHFFKEINFGPTFGGKCRVGVGPWVTWKWGLRLRDVLPIIRAFTWSGVVSKDSKEVDVWLWLSILDIDTASSEYSSTVMLVFNSSVDVNTLPVAAWDENIDCCCGVEVRATPGSNFERESVKFSMHISIQIRNYDKKSRGAGKFGKYQTTKRKPKKTLFFLCKHLKPKQT